MRPCIPRTSHPLFQDHGRSEWWFHVERIEIPPFTLFRWICAPPRFTVVRKRWPLEARHTRPKAESMPPLRLRAINSAPAPEGMESRIGPFTEVSEIGLARLMRSKPASSWPFTVESSAWPASPSALILPLTAEAFTEPATPLMESPPLISLTFSRLADRGTVMRYSTLAGRSASAPAYCVRIE